MKLQAQIGSEHYEVEIKEQDGSLIADVAGRKYKLDQSQPEPNVFLLKNEGKVYQAFVSPPDAQTDPMEVRVGPHEVEVQIVDPKRLRSSAGAGHDSDGLAEIKTAMPGKVVRILKGAGDQVEKGEGVIVVEAMKMQNEMRSPKDGTVKEIKVDEGDTVGAGEVLVVIE
jgi:biotin carboxyl carrier protein